MGPELRSPGTLSCPNQHGSPVDTDGEGGYAGVLKALEGQGQSANASESATRYHRLQRVQGDESSPQSWRNFQKPYLFCLWTVLLWADSELTGGGGDPLSHVPGVQSQHREQGGGWMRRADFQGTLTTPVSLVAKGARLRYRARSDGF